MSGLLCNQYRVTLGKDILLFKYTIQLFIHHLTVTSLFKCVSPYTILLFARIQHPFVFIPT